MKEKDIYDIEYMPNCNVCGVTNITKDGEPIECEHLFYVGINEMDEPMYDRNAIYKNIDTDAEDYCSAYDYLKENLSDEYYCENLLAKSPGNLHVYFIYHLPNKGE